MTIDTGETVSSGHFSIEAKEVRREKYEGPFYIRKSGE